MEEIIAYMERFLKRGKICAEFGLHSILKPPFFEKLENLINKYKEQQQVIQLMAKDIAENKLDENICRKMKNSTAEEDDCYFYIYVDTACRDCVIEYFKKKAKGE